MDKSVNISIAGISFKIEPEAYRILKDYLVRIEMGYKDNPDGPEIVADIEGRISELILNQQSANTPVTPKLIKDIISQLGYPDDMKEAKYDSGSKNPELSRRLYRNPDGAKIGGVCNGLATYFNIDPTIVRLIFCAPLVLAIFTAFIPFLNGFMGAMVGVSFLLYMILWFAVPKAVTPRQKLEMYGKEINVRTIEEGFRDDFNDVSSPEKSKRNASVLTDLIYVIGKIVLFIIKVFVLIIGFTIAVSILAAIFFAAILLVGNRISIGNDLWAAFGIQYVTPAVFTVLVVLLITIPMLILGYLLLKFVFRWKSGKTSMSVLFGVWIIILIYVGVLTVINIDNVRENARNGRIEKYFESNNFEFFSDDWEHDWNIRRAGWDGMDDKWQVYFDRKWERHLRKELQNTNRFDGVTEMVEKSEFRMNGKVYTYEKVFRDGKLYLYRNDRQYEFRDGNLIRLPEETYGGDSTRTRKRITTEKVTIDGKVIRDTVIVEYFNPDSTRGVDTQTETIPGSEPAI